MFFERADGDDPHLSAFSFTVGLSGDVKNGLLRVETEYRLGGVACGL